MTRHLVVALAFGFLVSAGLAEDKGASDQKKIQGTWTVVSGERDGKPIPEEKTKSVRVTFAGDQVTLAHGDESNKHTFKLNSSKNPKEIDVDFDGKPGLGIYELKGDTLKIAHGEMGSPRPKDFTSKEGSGLTVMTMKRQKK
jgi:uncharacterized protein (TIGR03067 family)